MKTSKRQFSGWLASLALVVAVGVSVPSVAHAQAQLDVKIPFEFFVGEHRFEPGRYQVLLSPDYLKLSDGKGHSEFVITNRVARPEWKNLSGGLLIFTHYDNAYFLSEVWREGYNTGSQLKKAPLEAQIASKSTHKEPITLRAGR